MPEWQWRVPYIYGTGTWGVLTRQQLEMTVGIGGMIPVLVKFVAADALVIKALGCQHQRCWLFVYHTTQFSLKNGYLEQVEVNFSKVNDVVIYGNGNVTLIKFSSVAAPEVVKIMLQCYRVIIFARGCQ